MDDDEFDRKFEIDVFMDGERIAVYEAWRIPQIGEKLFVTRPGPFSVMTIVDQVITYTHLNYNYDIHVKEIL